MMNNYQMKEEEMKSKQMLVKIIFCFLLIAITGNAQDTIIYKNGEKIIAIVKEVNVETIKFKSIENSEVDRIAYKKDVLSITYKNGTKEFFLEGSTWLKKENLFNNDHKIEKINKEKP